MKIQEILVHRVRDFEIIFNAHKKSKLFTYIFLRQIFKLFGIKEEKANRLIENNIVKLYNYKFFTRARTLDFLFFSRFYEPETTKFIIQNTGNIFLDVGAHTGRFSILASKNFNKIYAIEPFPENFSVLKKNLHINHIKNVYPINLAISDRNREVFLSELNMNTGAVRVAKKGKIKVKAITLDNLIKKNKIPLNTIHLIKIDVEGHELNVVKGAKKILKESNPVLIIESTKPNVEKLEKFLSKFGFQKKCTLDFYNRVFTKETPNS